jgi:hypothetical protein
MQNTARKQDSQDESNEGWWKDQLKKINTLSTENKIASIERLLGNTSRAETGWLAIEMRLYRLHLEFQRWTENPEADSGDAEKQGAIRDRHTVFVMRMVKELCDRGGIFPAARVVLRTVLQCIGFSDYVATLLDPSPRSSENERELLFKFIKLVRSKTAAPVHKYMSITEDPIVWQMRLFGEFMDRSMDSQPDPRVSFQPDAWQRRVLDCLDDVDENNKLNHSVLVVGELILTSH